MAQEPDSLAFRFAVVLALAVIVLLVTTWAAPPHPANDTAAPIPRSARNRVTKLLRARHVLRRGRRSDTNTRQIKIAELGTRVPCYALSRKRLRA
jgi:hypothetical protein